MTLSDAKKTLRSLGFTIHSHQRNAEFYWRESTSDWAELFVDFTGAAYVLTPQQGKSMMTQLSSVDDIKGCFGAPEVDA